LFISILKLPIKNLDTKLEELETETSNLEKIIIDIPFNKSKDLSQLRLNLHKLCKSLSSLIKLYRDYEVIANYLSDTKRGAFSENMPEIRDEMEVTFYQFKDQLLKSLSTTKELRSIHQALDGMLKSFQEDKTNRRLLALTYLSVFFLPVSMITGFFGMNIFSTTNAIDPSSLFRDYLSVPPKILENYSNLEVYSNLGIYFSICLIAILLVIQLSRINLFSKY